MTFFRNAGGLPFPGHGDAPRKAAGRGGSLLPRSWFGSARGRSGQLLIWSAALIGGLIGEAAWPLALIFSATAISLVLILWHADRSRVAMLEAAIEQLTRESRVYASGQDRAAIARPPAREP